MLGWDECSPSPAHDSQGNQCRDTCHEREVDGKVMMMILLMIYRTTRLWYGDYDNDLDVDIDLKSIMRQ